MRRLSRLGTLLLTLLSGPALAHRAEIVSDGVSLLSVAVTSQRTYREDINVTSSPSSRGHLVAAAAAKVTQELALQRKCWYYILAALIVAALVFEWVHRRVAGISFATPSDYEGPGVSSGPRAGTGASFAGLWKLTRVYFLDGENPRWALLLLCVAILLISFIVFVDLRLTQWMQEFYTSLVARDPAEFWAAFWVFAELMVAKIVGEMYRGYVKGLLKVYWRVDLTRCLQEKWLLGRAFCQQSFPRSPDSPSVDNPDQRLQEDTYKFVDLVLDLGLNLFSCVVHLAIFLPMIYRLSPPLAFGLFPCPGWLFYISLLYSLLSSLVTHFVGQNLSVLEYARQRHEANFRHAAVQVRDNAESISLNGSESAEHTRLGHLFHRSVRVNFELNRVTKYVLLILTFHETLSHFFIFAILAPNYFGLSIELGTMMQINAAHIHVQRTLSWFIDSYQKVAEFTATCARLTGFVEGVDHGVKEVCGTTISRVCLEKADMQQVGVPALSATGIRVTLPDGRAIWDDANLEVKSGERVLLLGPDGCGKSTFLRAISGCWPAEGKAIFSGRLLVVPQRPFLPSGSLHDAVSYPEASTSYPAKDVRAALHAVGLKELAERPLEIEGDWSVVLSGGEKQRLAFAHAILKQPQMLLLDEATSAVGEEAGAELYATLAAKLPPEAAIVSVAHDADGKVGPAHNVHLKYDLAGRWVQVHNAKK